MEVLRDPLIVYSLTLVIVLLSGFGTLYWMAKTNAFAEIENLKKTKETVEKSWFMPLFVVLMVLSSVTIAQDVLLLIPGFPMNLNSLPLLKYIFALGLGTITFIGGIIGRRKLKDLQS